MIILEVLSNDNSGVVFKSEYGVIRVPEDGFQPCSRLGYPTGILIAVDDSFWGTLELNGRYIPE